MILIIYTAAHARLALAKLLGAYLASFMLAVALARHGIVGDITPSSWFLGSAWTAAAGQPGASWLVLFLVAAPVLLGLAFLSAVARILADVDTGAIPYERLARIRFSWAYGFVLAMLVVNFILYASGVGIKQARLFDGSLGYLFVYLNCVSGLLLGVAELCILLRVRSAIRARA